MLEKGCVFGYAMSGPVDIQPQKERRGSTTSFYVDRTWKWPSTVEKTFESLETCGIKEIGKRKHFSRDITFMNGWYEVKLPEKDGHPLLHNNFMQASVGYITS